VKVAQDICISRKIPFSSNKKSGLDRTRIAPYNPALQSNNGTNMALIYLIRHGRASASFTDDVDPGLDDLGRSQAKGACEILASKLPLTLLSSPLARARETALPLQSSTGQTLGIETRVAEIPSPDLSLTERGPWLRKVMQGKWSEQSESLQAWRAQLGRCLVEIDTDTAIFSHYVAINAAVGIATNSDQVLIFQPDNASITIFETDGKQLKLVTRGDQASTKVN
jgi:broad specificity phosphatase PhoE